MDRLLSVLSLKGGERGSVSFDAKPKSQWNCLLHFHRLEPLDSYVANDNDRVIRRDDTCCSDPLDSAETLVYRMVNVFAKKSSNKGSKYLLRTEAKAKKNTTVNAQLLVFDEFTGTFPLEYVIDRRRLLHTYIVCISNEERT
jgi:hypothetical protein